MKRTGAGAPCVWQSLQRDCVLLCMQSSDRSPAFFLHLGCLQRTSLCPCTHIAEPPQSAHLVQVHATISTTVVGLVYLEDCAGWGSGGGRRGGGVGGGRGCAEDGSPVSLFEVWTQRSSAAQCTPSAAPSHLALLGSSNFLKSPNFILQLAVLQFKNVSMPADASAKGERRPRAEGEADEGWHEIEEEEPPRSEARRKALSEALQKVSPSTCSARGVWTQSQCVNAQAHERDARTRAHAHTRTRTQ